MIASLHKLAFCFKITSGLTSFLKLVWNSKKLRWSKSGLIKPARREVPSIAISLRAEGQRLQCLLRPYDGDIDIFFEVWYRKIYLLPEMVFRNALTIVDLGANTGLASLYFLVNAPQASVYAVEPDPLNFKILTKNLEQGKDRVTCLEAAVTDTDGIVGFKSAGMKYNSRIDAGGDSVVSISMRGLIRHFNLQQIDILKIDVEGSEKLIFSGDVSWLHCVKNIVVEIHDLSDRQQIEDTIQRYGFIMRPLKNDSSNEQVFWANCS